MLVVVSDFFTQPRKESHWASQRGGCVPLCTPPIDPPLPSLTCSLSKSKPVWQEAVLSFLRTDALSLNGRSGRPVLPYGIGAYSFFPSSFKTLMTSHTWIANDVMVAGCDGVQSLERIIPLEQTRCWASSCKYEELTHIDDPTAFAQYS